MQILIIGSKGFIGYHAVNYFISTGHVVYGCDVIVDYTESNYFLIDSTNADYHSIFQQNEFDVCINCSGAASVPDSFKNPLRDYTLNTYNVFKLLDAIRLYLPNCKFINLSSAAVYGNPQQLPILENARLSPMSPYGLHKLQAEQLCQEFYQLFALKTCSLRIFSAFGEGLKKQLFWDLYQKLKHTDEIVLFGTGNETRDFIYISDLVSAIDCVIKNADFKHTIVNVANGVEVTIKEVATLFASHFSTPKQITFNNITKEGDPLNWCADIKLLQSFGYVPKLPLKYGLNNYYQWVK